MKHTIYLWAIVALLVVGGGSFYAGMAYAGHSPSSGERSAAFSGGQLLSSGAASRFAGRGTGGGATAGEIIEKDATSITVKMQDGSTKIVLVSPDTPVMKAVAGTAGDLSVGTNVVVTGTANSDGSIAAESVQVRPATVPQGQSGNGGT